MVSAHVRDPSLHHRLCVTATATAIATWARAHRIRLGMLVVGILGEGRMDRPYFEEEAVSTEVGRIAEDLQDRDFGDPDGACPDIDGRKSR